MGSRSPMMVKAQVSPGLRTKTKPQTAQRSRSDQPEKSRPSPQCGHRLRRPRHSAVRINIERAGVLVARMRLALRRISFWAWRLAASSKEFVHRAADIGATFHIREMTAVADPDERRTRNSLRDLRGDLSGYEVLLADDDQRRNAQLTHFG